MVQPELNRMGEYLPCSESGSGNVWARMQNMATESIELLIGIIPGVQRRRSEGEFSFHFLVKCVSYTGFEIKNTFEILLILNFLLWKNSNIGKRRE